MLLGLFAVLLAARVSSEIITTEVSQPTVYNAPEQNYSHTVYAGINFQEFKPEVHSAVYSYRLIGDLPTNSSCSFSLPEIEKRKKVTGENGLNSSEFITQVVAMADKHKLIAVTNKGRLLKYSSKGKVELQVAATVAAPGNLHLLKTSNNELYLYNETGIYKVTIGSEGFGVEPLRLHKSPVKVLFYAEQFVLLFRDKVELWSLKKNTTETISLLGICDDLTDMDIYDNKVFLLSAKSGVAIASLLDFSISIFLVPTMDGSFKKLKMYNSTIFLIYTYRHRDYVAELFYDAQHRIDLNKFYRYLRNIHDFVFFKNFAVFLADTTIYYLRHSINRNIGYEKNSEVLFRESAFGLKTLAPYDDNDDSFVVVTHTHIAIVNMKHLTLIPSLRCEFSYPGNYKISIEYEQASCKQGKSMSLTDPRTSYCLHTINYFFNVKPVKTANELLVTHILLGVGLVFAFLLLVALVIYCRRVVLRNSNIVARVRELIRKRRQQTTLKKIKKQGGEKVMAI